jgi:hypothetical protein
MNFQDLLAKMKRLDEEEVVAVAPEASGDVSVEECGMDIMPMGRMPAPKQSDSVTMNVSMNGSGAGGIRDLLNVLKDIQDGSEHDVPHDDNDDTHDILIGEPEESYEEESIQDGGFGSATTNPDETTLNINSIFPRGNDMHSNQGDHRPRQAGLPMGNPHVHESLVKQLSAHYKQIKGR